MTTRTKSVKLPRIIIGDEDFKALRLLADNVGGHLAAAAEQLVNELERAKQVAQAKVPAAAVSMGDYVFFENGDGTKRRIQLVFPDQADIAEGRISVLTPVGAALIGLSETQSISFVTPKGDTQTVTVIRVEKPEA
ncbi:MAG: nucleoside diphosphate kinase regulator [Asticcacaulis sp.]